MNTQRQNRRGSETGEGEWLKAMFEDLTRKTTQNITQSLTHLLEEKVDGFEKRLDQKLEMMDKRIKAEIQDVRERLDKLEIEKDNELDRLTLVEQKEKEYCLRLRGVAGKKEEEIRETIVQMLANLIDWEEERLEEDRERIFRVNSKYASAHQKPRDIVIEFSRKKTKEMILQASNDKKINIEGEDIMIERKKRKERKNCKHRGSNIKLQRI